MVFYTIFCNFVRYLTSGIAHVRNSAAGAISMNHTELTLQMKLHRLIFIPCLALASLAQAIDVTSTPGGLAQAIGTQTDISSLTVKGEINAADFQFIADNLHALRSLDLSEVEVAAYEGDPLTTGSRIGAAGELPPYALAGSRITSLTLPDGITAIGEGAFLSVPLTSIEIPATVTTIGAAAFSGCRSLERVTLPSTVKTVGTHLFMGCDNLQSATLPAALGTVPAATFADCGKLSEVTLPTAVTAVDSAAFAGCTTLAAINIGNSVRTIGPSAFRNSGITQIDLQKASALREIGAWAFANCTSLTSVSLPDNVTTIGKGAFFDDNLLTNANFPTSTTSIADYTYNGASALNPANISHSSITTIGDYALRGISEAEKFDLPSSLQSIGDYAMEDWTSLKELTALTAEVPATGTDVWAGVDQSSVKLFVKSGMQTAFSEAPQWKEFTIMHNTGLSDEIAAAESSVKASFSGTNLIITADTEIGNVRIFDSAARQWAGVKPAATQVTIDTAAWQSRIYIVTVELADGRTANFKLARR